MKMKKFFKGDSAVAKVGNFLANFGINYYDFVICDNDDTGKKQKPSPVDISKDAMTLGAALAFKKQMEEEGRAPKYDLSNYPVINPPRK